MDSIGQLFNDLLESVECVGSQLLERGDTRSPLSWEHKFHCRPGLRSITEELEPCTP